MMDFKVKTWLNSKQVVAAVNQAKVPRLNQCGLLVEREAKLSMHSGRSTGPKGGQVNTPSPPGEPPHTQSVNLQPSIQTRITQWLTCVVGPTLQAWYGKLLEFGTALIAKRPFMRPALEKTRSMFPALFRNLPIAHTPAGRWLNSRKGPV